MTSRTVLITGSAGHLGRALRSEFEAQGDVVFGIDQHAATPPHQNDISCDLDHDRISMALVRLVGDHPPDIVICNAKLRTCETHAWLAEHAEQCIVNISSIYGVLGNDPKMYEGTEIEPTPAWYAASKGALISLTRWQATNLRPVRSNCVCPGGIFRSHSDTFRERYESRVPLGRMATEADIVPLIVFLCSADASYITGQVIAADGGYSSW